MIDLHPSSVLDVFDKKSGCPDHLDDERNNNAAEVKEDHSQAL